MKSLLPTVALLGLLSSSELSTGPGLDAFRYNRDVVYPASSAQNASPNACAVLDASVFAHTQSGLADLRVFDPAGEREIPYVATLSSTSPISDPARIVRVSPSGARQLNADLEMPHRSYSQVDLAFNARNFVASAHVTGLRTLTDPSPVFLGDFTLFDLTAQHLGSGLSIPIAESTFPYLRLHLTFEPAPGNSALLITPSTVSSAQVPPARVAQTLYTGVAQSFRFAQRGSQTVVSFSVPAHVPIERVSFDLDPTEQSNFSRPVTISASTGQSAPQEALTGQISRVHLTVGSQEIQQQSLSVPAILGSNAQSPATVEVAVQNGQQPPLKIRSVRLEMRQRQLCFPAAGTSVTLAYGSDSAQPPNYDFARTFNASTPARRATLLKEHRNPVFIAPESTQSRFNRYPAFLGLSILVALSLLAVIAYRALHRGHHDSLRR
jgi:hypothetical protein